MDSILGGLSNLRVDTVLSAVDKYVPGAQTKIKNLADKAKAYVNNVSELEMKVLEATNHEPWGPHGSAMQEITQHAFNAEGFHQIMGVVDQRLSEGPDNWRLVYKTLLLLEYMLKHGPMDVAEALAAYSRMSLLEKLKDRFEFKDPTGHDQGINVRQRAGALVVLLNDRDKLTEERQKAAKNKSKYTGVSSSSMRYGGFGGGGGSSYSSSSYESSSSSSAPTYDRSTSSMSSSTYGATSSSRSTAAAATSSSPAEPADPVEATRQRIVKLKEQGAIADGSSGSGANGGSSVGLGLEDPTSPESRKPKKLSDIKINPAISATFAKGGLAPPPPTGAKAAAGPAAAPAAAGIDLLADLDVPPVASSSSAAATAASGAADEWDGFASAAPAGGAVPAAAAAGDEWAAFNSAPAPAAAKSRQGSLDINALLGPIPSTTPAASRGSAPLPLDDFCSMPPVLQQPAAPSSSSVAAAALVQARAPAAAAADPFGPFVAPTSGTAAAPFAGGSFQSAAPAVSSDPFAASGTVHMMAEAPKQHAATGPKLGPETAKAKDPFADLALI